MKSVNKSEMKIPMAALVLMMTFMINACGQNSGGINKEKNLKEGLQTTSFSEKQFKVTFIELGSVRCIPCQQMQPVMKTIKEKYGKDVNVIFYDVWTEEGKPYGVKYGIEAIPTQVFLDGTGEEYYRHVGFFPEEELVQILAQKGVKKN